MSADEGDKDDKVQEALYELLLSPLDLLQVVPTDLPTHLVKYAVWKDSNDEDRQKIHTAHAWISDVQRLLLEKILVDWVDELQDLPWLLEAWFAPVSKSSQRNGSKAISSANAGTIYIATLSTLTTVLSSASLKYGTASLSSSSTPLALALPAESVIFVTKILVLFSNNFSLAAIADSLQRYHTKTKRDIIWTTVVRDLTSLPERAANATSGSGPLELGRRHFVKTLAARLDDLLHSSCPPELTATLLTKLLRSGYFEETTSIQEEPINIWPTFLRRSISRDQKDAGTWPYAMQLLPLSTQTSIILSFISFVDRYSIQKGQSSSLLNGSEHIKSGTEGQRFLDPKIWTSVLTIAATIEPLVSAAPTTKLGHQEEEDSDSDEEEGTSSLLETLILPSSTGHWSPLMARLIIHLFCRQASEKHQSQILSKTIEAWSSATRIKTALWQQEIYLTTVVLLLVAQLSSASVSTFCTSSTFISGVSAHLEHLSPNVRRNGMLVAEVVSTASGNKALSFGRSIWDGKGEGKEEARVLRAMYHGWNSREKETTVADEQSKLSAFGLSADLEVAKIESLNYVKKQRTAPKTRVLPAKRSAPSRKRLLIQSLDDEDTLQDDSLQEDALPSLTNIQGIRGENKPTTYISDGEVSSSSESESSDSEAEGGNIPEVPEEKKEEFGLGMPTRKKRRVPIYIHELAPLFREQEREANKLAIKHAESLIKKKTGWGGEIDENAINLALAILSLQNNFAFKLFEEKKKSIMTALVNASPRLVAPCLAEQYFNQQYSMSQRVLILNSLAFGARQLSETGKQGEGTSLKTLADGFSHMAIVRSRVEGERRIPQSRPGEKAFLLHQQSAPKSLDAGSNKLLKLVKGSNVYLDLAGPSFIFPLVNRFWAHLDHANSTRSSRYRGSGSSILFDSFLVGAFLDTLAVLCYCAQNAVNFSSDIVPEVINLALTMTNSALSRLSQGEEVSDSQGGGPLSILGAAANLFLLLMDAVSEVDPGRILMHRHRALVQQVETWAQAVFESVEASAGIDRAGRCSAALLVRINELKSN